MTPPRHNEPPGGVTGTIAALGDHIVTSLPSQFLALVLLNTFFIVGLLWFLDRENTVQVRAEEHAAESRERMLMPILSACVRETTLK